MVGGRSLTALTSLVALVSLTAVPVAGQDASLRSFKGNTHTHTLNSDGDSTPDEVVRWYREHRYHFLVLSDRDFPDVGDGTHCGPRCEQEVPPDSGRGSHRPLR